MFRILLLLLLPLGGCVTADPVRVYTRAEVDAVNAEAACKALARNLLQVARCEVRR